MRMSRHCNFFKINTRVVMCCKWILNTEFSIQTTTMLIYRPPALIKRRQGRLYSGSLWIWEWVRGHRDILYLYKDIFIYAANSAYGDTFYVRTKRGFDPDTHSHKQYYGHAKPSGLGVGRLHLEELSINIRGMIKFCWSMLPVLSLNLLQMLLINLICRF